MDVCRNYAKIEVVKAHKIALGTDESVIIKPTKGRFSKEVTKNVRSLLKTVTHATGLAK